MIYLDAIIRFFADADWDVVNQYVDIQDPYKTLEEEVMSHQQLQWCQMSTMYYASYAFKTKDTICMGNNLAI